nr:hypothetical protein [Tanacetum cinerariifolium]
GVTPMKRGDSGVLEPAAERSIKIVLKRNSASINNQVKEKHVNETPVKGKMMDDKIDDDLDGTLEALNTQKLKGVVDYEYEATKISIDAQLLMDFKKTCKLSRKKALIQELSKGQGEGSRTRIQTQEPRDSLYSDLSATRLYVIHEGEEDDASNFTDNVSRYLNENHAPYLEDVSLPKAVGTAWLNSHDESFGKEKPKGDSVDPDQLHESQTVVVPERKMEEFIAHSVPAAVQESVFTKVIQEVKKHAPSLVFDAVTDTIRPRLHKVVSHVLRTEQITLTSSPTLSSTNITIPQLKETLYDRMTTNPELSDDDVNTALYIALAKSIKQ